MGYRRTVTLQRRDSQRTRDGKSQDWRCVAAAEAAAASGRESDERTATYKQVAASSRLASSPHCDWRSSEEASFASR